MQVWTPSLFLYMYILSSSFQSRNKINFLNHLHTNLFANHNSTPQFHHDSTTIPHHISTPQFNHNSTPHLHTNPFAYHNSTSVLPSCPSDPSFFFFLYIFQPIPFTLPKQQPPQVSIKQSICMKLHFITILNPPYFPLQSPFLQCMYSYFYIIFSRSANTITWGCIYITIHPFETLYHNISTSLVHSLLLASAIHLLPLLFLLLLPSSPRPSLLSPPTHHPSRPTSSRRLLLSLLPPSPLPVYSPPQQWPCMYAR